MLKDIIAENQQYIDEVKEWSDEQYNKYFARYFRVQDRLWSKMQPHDDHVDLSDAELSDILTKTPLDLIQASAQLAEFRTQQEIIKLRVKQKQTEFVDRWKNNLVEGYSITQLKQDAAESVAEDKLLVTVYENIITRVEKQISYSRELIMGAKKIWDARRNSELPIQGGLDDSETGLSEYNFNTKPSTYVR